MQIVRCGDCGMMYQNPRVAETEMPDAYELIEGYGTISRAHGPLSAQRQASGVRLLPEHRRGAGHHARRRFRNAAAMGCHGGGVVTERRRSAAGPRASRRALHPGAESGRGGSIGSNIDNVLEHLLEPVAVLRDLKMRLRPGGRQETFDR